MSNGYGIPPRIIAEYFELGETLPVLTTLERLAEIHRQYPIQSIRLVGYESISTAEKRGVPCIMTAIPRLLPDTCWSVDVDFIPCGQKPAQGRVGIFRLYNTRKNSQLIVKDEGSERAFLPVEIRYPSQE